MCRNYLHSLMSNLDLAWCIQMVYNSASCVNFEEDTGLPYFGIEWLVQHFVPEGSQCLLF